MSSTSLRNFRLSWFLTLALILAFALYVGFTLPQQRLHHYDEYLTLERTERLITSGDWMCIRNNGQPAMQKPPLQYFLGAMTILLGVPTEVGLPIWPLIFTVGTLLTVALLASELEPREPYLPLLSVLFCLSSSYLVELSCMVMLDNGYAFFIVFAIYAILRAQIDPKWWLIWGAATGLGSLHKVPMALFASLWVGLVYFGLQGKPLNTIFSIREFRWGLFVSLFPIGVWTLLQNVVDHVAYRRQYVSELLLRSTVGIGVDWSHHSLFNFDWLEWLYLDSALFWLTVIVVTLLHAGRRSLRDQHGIIAILTYCLFILSVFTLGGGPFYDRYIVTLSPLLASVTAVLLCRLSGGFRLSLVLAVLAFACNAPTLGNLPYQGHVATNALERSSRAFAALIEEDETPVYFSSEHDGTLVSARAKLEKPILFCNELPCESGRYLALVKHDRLDSLGEECDSLRLVKRMGPYSFARFSVQND